MKTLAFALAAVAALSASAAPAKPVDDLPSIRVSYADLDLGKPAGRATLERRVGAAVSRLCGHAWPISPVSVGHYRTCRKTTWSGARTQLAAIYERTRYAEHAPIVLAASN